MSIYEVVLTNGTRERVEAERIFRTNSENEPRISITLIAKDGTSRHYPPGIWRELLRLECAIEAPQ